MSKPKEKEKKCWIVYSFNVRRFLQSTVVQRFPLPTLHTRCPRLQRLLLLHSWCKITSLSEWKRILSNYLHSLNPKQGILPIGVRFNFMKLPSLLRKSLPSVPPGQRVLRLGARSGFRPFRGVCVSSLA